MTPELDWSDWTPLDSFEETGDLGFKETGVYQIRATEDGEPVPIPRWLGVDEDGLLYVGCTESSIGTRLTKFLEGIEDHGKSHTAGKKRYILRRWASSYEEQFGGHVRECRWAATEDGKAKQTEKDLLQPYVAQFGEAPPLNGTFAYRMEPEVWEDRYGDQ